MAEQRDRKDVSTSGQDRDRPGKVKGKHDKPKPWDHDGINHWEIQKFTKDDNPSGLLEESSFAILFPKYREKYLREAWPVVTRALKEVGIACELNLVEGSMTVRTTRNTWDPYIIIKARDLLKLLARSVPAAQALKILNDDMQCDIIKIGGLIRNKEKFVKRRHRLLGPNGATLKALELLTNCYILVQGSTVAAMGPYKGLKQVRRVATDCILNLHPIYHIKTLMIKRELGKDPALKEENWERFLPRFKKKNVPRKKPPAPEKSKKKEYTPFPPPQQPSKVDLQLESGEYFLAQQERVKRSKAAQQAQQLERAADKTRKRQEAFVPPQDKPAKAAASPAAAPVAKEGLAELTESLKRKAQQKRKGDEAGAGGLEQYLAVPKGAKAGVKPGTEGMEPRKKKKK